MKKIAVYLNRLRGFWNTFKRSKKGLVGICIIFLFVFVAIAAPILTPYDPLNDRYLAGTRAKPSWVKYFGYQVSENLDLIRDPGFSSTTSIEGWSISSGIKGVSLFHSSDVGFNDLGSMAISIKRSNEEPAYGRFNVIVEKPFHYPYQVPSDYFVSSLSVKGGGLGQRLLGSIRTVIVDANKKEYILWEDRITEEWKQPKPRIHSANMELRMRLFGDVLADPAELIFSAPGDYAIKLELDLLDRADGEGIDARIFIDDFAFSLKGDSFGLLGTDYYGRDLFSQLIYGSRVSLIVGLLVAVFSTAIGLAVGVIAGYVGGIVDEVLMRITDMLLVLPGLPLFLVLMGVLGPSIWNIILIMTFLGWMGFSRVIRSQVLSLKERPFVEAARAAGSGSRRIIVKHLIPNVMSLAYVALALAVPSAILTEAAISWLGWGDPWLVSWGRMLYDVTYYGSYADWWWVIPPGICIALLSLSFIFIGYALDEIFNPRLRKVR